MAKLILNNKAKIFISAVLVCLAIGYAFLVKNGTQAEEETAKEKKSVAVTTKVVADLRSISGALNYPATVTSEQEVKVTAGTSGTASSANFDLGDSVSAGKLLVRIDDQGTAIGAGESGFKSGQIQQLEKALEIADESYDLAKDNYKKDRSKANKAAKDIAELQKESADIALNNAVNGHLITAPISGIVTSRAISAGDSVSAGQLLATISKTGKVKIQFFVDKDALPNISLGKTVTAFDNQKEIAAKVTNISPQADAVTKRFLIEAFPPADSELISGTVISVRLSAFETNSGSGTIFLPLSSITITQNENYIFIIEEGKAKKVSVEVRKISGETAEVKAELQSHDQIIVEGNKLVQDGQEVDIAKQQ